MLAVRLQRELLMRMLSFRLVTPLAAALLLAAAAPPAPGRTAAARADLAVLAQRSYFDAVISDARGESRSDVRIQVTKIGPNRVRVTSDYPRLPPFTAALGRAMSTIQNVGGGEVFLLDTSKSPPSLMI